MSVRDHKTRTLVLTGMLHTFTHLYHAALLPLYLLVQRDLNLGSVDKATSFVTVLLVAYYLPSYVLGILADHMSRKKLLVFGLFLNAVAFVGLAYAPNYWVAMVCVIIAGIGGSSYHPAATAMIARLFPQNTGRALGIVGAGSGLGFFLGPLYTGWRAATLEPLLGPAAWRQPILEIGVAGIIAAGLFAWFAREETIVAGHEKKEMSAGKLFPTPALWFFFILACLFISLRDFDSNGVVSLTSLFLQNTRGFDTRHAGLAVSALCVGSIIGNPLLSSLSDRHRKRWITLVVGVGSLLIIFLPHVPAGWMFPYLFVYGFFFLAAFPIIETALVQSVPDAVRGRVFGFYVMITGVVGALAPWIIGLRMKFIAGTMHEERSYHGLFTALGCLGLLVLAGVPCLHAIRKREHLADAAGPGCRVPTPEFK